MEQYLKECSKFLEQASKATQEGSTVVIPDYYLDDLQDIIDFIKEVKHEAVG